LADEAEWVDTATTMVEAMEGATVVEVVEGAMVVEAVNGVTTEARVLAVLEAVEGGGGNGGGCG
jgi:hypothetical protein